MFRLVVVGVTLAAAQQIASPQDYAKMMQQIGASFDILHRSRDSSEAARDARHLSEELNHVVDYWVQRNAEFKPPSLPWAPIPRPWDDAV